MRGNKILKPFRASMFIYVAHELLVAYRKLVLGNLGTGRECSKSSKNCFRWLAGNFYPLKLGTCGRFLALFFSWELPYIHDCCQLKLKFPRKRRRRREDAPEAFYRPRVNPWNTNDNKSKLQCHKMFL